MDYMNKSIELWKNQKEKLIQDWIELRSEYYDLLKYETKNKVLSGQVSLRDFGRQTFYGRDYHMLYCDEGKPPRYFVEVSGKGDILEVRRDWADDVSYREIIDKKMLPEKVEENNFVIIPNMCSDIVYTVILGLERLLEKPSKEQLSGVFRDWE